MGVAARACVILELMRMNVVLSVIEAFVLAAVITAVHSVASGLLSI